MYGELSWQGSGQEMGGTMGGAVGRKWVWQWVGQWAGSGCGHGWSSWADKHVQKQKKNNTQMNRDGHTMYKLGTGKGRSSLLILWV